MIRACVIGWPIKHSRSPLIHGYWLKAYGIVGSYEKVAVPPEELAGFLGSLAQSGYAGCNVTVPHKEAAYRLCAEMHGSLHADAAVVGAVNTLWVEGSGRLHGTSTDAYGFMTHLMASVPNLALQGRSAMVLGAGGSAQSVVQALMSAGAGEIRIANRSMERALELARSRSDAKITAVPWEDRSRALRDCAVLVNATTLGMVGQPPLAIDLDELDANAVVYDIVYVPLETPLLRSARQRGLTTVDGLGMLLHQAVPGFQRWFGRTPEVTGELRQLLVADIEAA